MNVGRTGNNGGISIVIADQSAVRSVLIAKNFETCCDNLF